MKGLSASWEQESADAAGEAACSYAIKWNNAVIPEIDAKIQKFQAEYDEKQAQYSAVKEQYDAAEQAVRDAQNDIIFRTIVMTIGWLLFYLIIAKLCSCYFTNQ